MRSHQPGLATIRLNSDHGDVGEHRDAGEHGDGGQMLAVWAGGFVLPLAEAARRCGVAGAPPDSLRQALPDWDRWCGVVRQVTADGGPGERGPGERGLGERGPEERGPADGGWQDETAVTFLPAVTDPPTVYCAAANYHDHLREMRGKDARAAQSPMYFVAPPASLGGHREDVVRPAGCERLDWEVELAVVIGRDAKDVAAADADRVIAGYSVANDVSLRDFARREDYPFFPDWLRSKSYAGCLPLGPAVVPASLVPDPMNLSLSLTVNGAERQASSSKNMIFSIAEQIEYLSHIVPLRPGDIILTGTPAGTASAWGSYLSPGDVMVAEIECLGRLETQVKASADTLPGPRGMKE